MPNDLEGPGQPLVTRQPLPQLAMARALSLLLAQIGGQCPTLQRELFEVRHDRGNQRTSPGAEIQQDRRVGRRLVREDGLELLDILVDCRLSRRLLGRWRTRCVLLGRRRVRVCRLTSCLLWT